jgi:hypothetical protein
MPPHNDRKRLEAALDAFAGRAWSRSWRQTLHVYLTLIKDADTARNRAEMLCVLASAFRKRARLRNSRHALRYAIARAEEASQQAEASGDAGARARALGTLGKIFYDIGDRRAEETALARAESLFLQGLALLAPSRHPEIAITLELGLADVHAVRHRVDGAARHLAAARPLYRYVRRSAPRLHQPLLWTRAAANLLRMERDAAGGRADADALHRVAGRQRRVLSVLERVKHDAQAADVRHALAVSLTMIADTRRSCRPSDARTYL